MRAVALTFVTCLLCLMLAIIPARQRNPPALPAWLDGCGLPCWRGIIPGQTSYLDAVRLLQAQPDLSLIIDPQGGRGFNFLRTEFTVHTAGGERGGEMLSDGDGNRVQYIYFNALNDHDEGLIRLTDLVLIFGAPDAIMDSVQSGAPLRFSYARLNMEALNYYWTLYPDTRACRRFDAIVGLYLGSDPNFHATDRWRGFNAQFDSWCDRRYW